MYFHTDDPGMIGFLADVLKTAEDTGTRIRLDVTADGSIKIKRGEGIWSPAFHGTPDPHRDVSGCQRKCTELGDASQKHYLNCTAWAHNARG